MAIKRLYDTLVGATVNVNQLCNSSSVTVPNGHKYYMIKGGTASIGASTGTAITGLTSGTDIVIDLTAMLGSTIADYLYSLETATAGAGVAKLKEWGFFTGEYIPYNSGSLESVEATAHKMVGFNLFNKDEAVEGVYIRDNNGGEGATQGAISTGWIPVIGGEDYFIVNTATSGRWGAWYDADKIFISACVGAGVKTAPLNARYMRMTIKNDEYSLGSVDTFCFSLSSDRNGEYEPYVSHTYDLGTDTLRGLFKLDSNNNLYADGDTKASDGTVTRKYGIRAYQSGDESLADAITDGTNTVYKLTTPTTEQSTPFTNPQICDPDGTEEYVTSNGVPVGHETRYQL